MTERVREPPYGIETALSPHDAVRFLLRFTSGEPGFGGIRWRCGDCGEEYAYSVDLHSHHRRTSDCFSTERVLFGGDGRMRGRVRRSRMASTDADVDNLLAVKQHGPVPTGVEP